MVVQTVQAHEAAVLGRCEDLPFLNLIILQPSVRTDAGAACQGRGAAQLHSIQNHATHARNSGGRARSKARNVTPSRANIEAGARAPVAAEHKSCNGETHHASHDCQARPTFGQRLSLPCRSEAMCPNDSGAGCRVVGLGFREFPAGFRVGLEKAPKAQLLLRARAHSHGPSAPVGPSVPFRIGLAREHSEVAT